MREDDVLLTEDRGAVRLLTLNRPQRRNALDPELIAAFELALARASFDAAVRVLIVTGAAPAFCAGLDFDAYFAPGADRTVPGRVLRSVSMVPKPVIAAVNGAAATGGLELALNCDFIIASTEAKFMDTHLRVGALPGGGITARLTQAVGMRRARQLSFTAEPLDAAAALEFGLVNEVVAPESLLPRVWDIADAIAKWDPAMVATVKSNYEAGHRAATAEALESELVANTRRRWAKAAESA